MKARGIIGPRSSPRCRRSVGRIGPRTASCEIDSSGLGDYIMSSYWAVARLQPRHEHAGLVHLGLNGYEIYYPRVREKRIRHGRRIELRPPLFWGYCFFLVENGVWYTARWAIGVCGVIMDGIAPGRVPDAVIDELRQREVNGAIDLPRRNDFKFGDRVRVLHGPFAGHLALFEGMKPRERVEVLLELLGSLQKVELVRSAVEPVPETS
jgi:transcriptional antiterminator RfaH